MSSRSILPRYAAAPLAALVLLACGESPSSGGEDPRPVSVEPGAGTMGAPTPVTIHGDNFLALTVNPASGGAQTDAHHRAWLGGAELLDLVWVDPHTLRATIPAGLPPGPQMLEVENAFGRKGQLESAFVVTGGALSAELAADPATVSVGQAGKLTLTVTNTGVRPLSGIGPGAVPTITASGGAAATVSADSGQASIAALGPNERATFTWSFKATAAGQLSFLASATGYDSASQIPVSGAGTAQVGVQPPAALMATMAAASSAVSAGGPIVLSLTVTNSGGAGAATAVNVAPATPTMSSQNGATAEFIATPQPGMIPTLAAGESHTFTWTLNALAGGTLTLGTAGAGGDANSGAVVKFGPVGTQVRIQQVSAQLAVSTEQGIPVPPGSHFFVTMAVTNRGDAPVTGISAVLQPDAHISPAPPANGVPTVKCVTTLLCITIPGTIISPPSADLAAGGQVTFTWEYINVTSSTATITLGGSATGTGQDGPSVTASDTYSLYL